MKIDVHKSTDRGNVITLLEDFLREFSRTEYGNFLNKFDYKKIPYSIDKKCNEKTGVLGIYYQFSNSIGFMDSPYPYLIFPTLVHEYRHAYQRVKFGYILYLVLKTFFRPLIERDARHFEQKAEDWINSINAINARPQ